jgi:hypothetical protein
VRVTRENGKVSHYDERGVWLDGERGDADPNMCNWIGGRQLPDAESVPSPPPGPVPEGANLRQVMAAPSREALRPVLGDHVDQISDAELLDSIYLSVFPNFHPWGSFNRIVYRFRPNGSNPNECIHECMYFAAVPVGEPRPAAAPIHWLGPDDDWVDAPELGLLAKVFNQDVHNLPSVQAGLKTMQQKHVIFADYGETKPRHFHTLLEEWINRP